MARNRGGMTALHLLSFFGKWPGGRHHQGINLLLSRGADATISAEKDGQQYTPARMASLQNTALMQLIWPTMPHHGLVRAEHGACGRDGSMCRQLLGGWRQALASVLSRPLFYWVFINWAAVYLALPALTAETLLRGHGLLVAAA